MASALQLPSKGANMVWLSQVELLDAGIYPLPGGSLRRGTANVDPRLIVAGAKSSDVITMYEHVASVRHKPTLQIYVAFRETLDALMRRQADPGRFPAWLMKHPVKQTERHIHILRAKANPKPIAAAKGLTEMWFTQWLAEIEDDSIHESLAYYLLNNKLVNEEFVVKA